ncbi:branched-chain amino acid ABC transporter permease [Bosea sp. (in: a-proteobacteria)]|uniref:branched-chain amino acid ABC transporter permease n=1 Tax=Bosea sp. (in: a-proteobacteria) TaxID=1871050 RepID=UPI00260A3BFB|nr:branched-chain amino acid ABC transporter permease [Bosea sp. (in: a-proteobacteria)]MCO5089662.1 branched-chain amino acid ABC transporter permease [Bosea sp. (in: a-proteobacteria)]
MLQYLVTGLAIGSLYALLGLGLALTYRSTTVLNFAQGELAMLMAFVCYLGIAVLGLSPLAAMALTLVVGILLGIGLYNLIIFPNRERDHESLAVVTLGMKLALTGLVAWVLGVEAREFPPIFGTQNYTAFGLMISPGQFWTLVVGLVAMVAVTAFLKFTSLGLAMRAAAEDVNVAQLLGIDLRVVGSLAWIAAVCLGAVTGVLFSATVLLSPYMMGLAILKGFAALVLGGMTSVPGVIVGGLLVGVLESLVAYYLTPLLQESVALVLIIGILLVRPQGLFGSAPAWRA